jgi:hypothetical protein
LKLKKKHLHIHRVLSILLLWVFAIALTPFSAFHDHHHAEPKCVAHEKACTHKVHVSNHAEECLICAAHFEKNYIATAYHFEVYLVNKPATPYYPTVSGFYTELVGLALRGPPVA